MPIDLSSIATQQTIYIGLSAVVAVLIGVAGQMLKKTKGKLPKSAVFVACSVLDTSWSLVSVIVIFLWETKSLALVVPVVYGVYTVAGWVYGTYLLRQQGKPTDPKKLRIPMAYISFSQSFAVVFFALCVFVLFVIHSGH